MNVKGLLKKVPWKKIGTLALEALLRKLQEKKAKK